MNLLEKLELRLGDITEVRADAIVNAANRGLEGGGGVDGAIHRAAGAKRLQAALAPLRPCATGDAVVTPAFGLPARVIVHAVGPVWQGGHHDEEDLLASCYQRALQLAVEEGCRTVAFPSISTGAYGYPVEAASRTALREVKHFLERDEPLDRVIFVLHSDRDLDVYRQAASEVFGTDR